MTLKKSSMARCHNSTAAFATRWSHSQRSQAPRQSQTPEKIGVKLHRSIGGQPERGGDKIGVNSCYMLYYIILYLYCMISHYIILCCYILLLATRRSQAPTHKSRTPSNKGLIKDASKSWLLLKKRPVNRLLQLFNNRIIQGRTWWAIRAPRR